MVEATQLSVGALAQALAEAIGAGIVDVRYHRGLWGVLVPCGHIMVKVPGSFHNSYARVIIYLPFRWRMTWCWLRGWRLPRTEWARFQGGRFLRGA